MNRPASLLHSLRRHGRRPAWAWLLGAWVLLMQQGALHHRHEHGLAPQDRHEATALHTACLTCLAFHALDHAAPAGAVPAVPLAQAPSVAPRWPGTWLASADAVTARARGPPRSVNC